MKTVANHSDRRYGSANVLTEDEVRAILATFSRRTPCAIRNRALVLFLWRTGLRVSEALAVETRDLQLDGDSPRVNVRNAKFGKQRVVGIHQEAIDALERWLDQRQRLGFGRLKPIWITISSDHHGKPLAPSYVREMLSKKGAQAGVTGRVHPHAFRATLAVELAREGVPLPAIRDVLGHANIACTDAYLRRVFPEDAISAVIHRGPEEVLPPPAPPPPPVDPRERLIEAILELDDLSVKRLTKALSA
jgi:integrase/recombinase XerD